VKVASLAAHTDTIVTDLDFISQRWRHGSDMVLVCTDEVFFPSFRHQFQA